MTISELYLCCYLQYIKLFSYLCLYITIKVKINHT